MRLGPRRRTGPVGCFWTAVRDLDPAVHDDGSRLAGVRQGHLAELLEAAGGLASIDEAIFVVRVEHPTFDEWWEPFTLGVAPAGAYVAGLDPAGREELEERCRQLAPVAPFTLDAHAWAALGHA